MGQIWIDLHLQVDSMRTHTLHMFMCLWSQTTSENEMFVEMSTVSSADVSLISSEEKTPDQTHQPIKLQQH